MATKTVAHTPYSRCEVAMTSTDGTKSPYEVLLYSDNVDVRAEVRSAVGELVEDVAVRWQDVATSAALDELVKKNRYDLIILDGEAHKVGGMGIARELKNAVYDCPPILVLTGRAQDAWLASWSLADEAVPRPLDAFELQSAVARLLTNKDLVPGQE
ncbi:response regulator [Timonella senegalensis]|uniref:hypothetical protein n=1 Tax=Timonella senegalensis TaxID=1465825 RepID=UPI0028AD07FF|nr:hypothetical protein [Timonella senegalensis]